MYDIVYDELRLFPDLSVTTSLLSSPSCEEENAVESPGYTRLTARRGAQTAVVVTHHFSTNGVQCASESACGAHAKKEATVVVLDVSNVPLADAAVKIAVEVAWAAGYASMQGALGNATCVVVRLPFVCDFSSPSGTFGPAVQEGLDFIAEHIALLPNGAGGDAVFAGEIYFAGAADAQLQEVLTRVCAGRPRVVVFAGDHHQRSAEGKKEEQQKWSRLENFVASSLGATASRVNVPLRCFLDGPEEQWEAATTRENQLLNFCPCCGHCGDH